MNNKKKSNRMAKNAKRLLKTEKKDILSEKKIQQKLISTKQRDRKCELNAQENKWKLRLNKIKLSKNKKRLELIKKGISKENLVKYDKKVEKELHRMEIKRINRLNKNPKGLKFISNSSDDIIIDVQNLKKIYTTKSLIFNALDGVSLKIKKGEFVAILGPSGSGKSTLLNVMSGLDRPTEGKIIIDGENISALKEKELTTLRRKKIGFVFQSYNLLSTLNVSDNVEIGRSLQTDKSKRLNINSTLNDMGMADQAKKRTFELSGGQQQRVSIARAIAKAPEILFGDEPTGALDTKSRIDVFKLFQEINRKNNTTIIIVTHNNMIAKLANKIINVEDGKIKSVKINSKPIDASQLGKAHE